MHSKLLLALLDRPFLLLGALGWALLASRGRPLYRYLWRLILPPSPRPPELRRRRPAATAAASTELRQDGASRVREPPDKRARQGVQAQHPLQVWADKGERVGLWSFLILFPPPLRRSALSRARARLAASVRACGMPAFASLSRRCEAEQRTTRRVPRFFDRVFRRLSSHFSLPLLCRLSPPLDRRVP